MAERLAEGGDLAVDELRRKARRRLVGAIVLALAAAIIVPMVLEDEPRPLGDDVSVRIPPLDEGKFVNRLTGVAPDAESTAPPPATPTTAPPATPITAPATAPPATPITAPATAPPATPITTPATAPPATSAEPTAASSPAAPAASAAGTSGTKQTAPDAQRRASSPAAKSGAGEAPTRGAAVAERETEPKVAGEASAQSASIPKAAPASPPDGYVVQLAAFADDKGANALANKLKRANYAAYVEPVTTSRGTLWRVRVGGYASRPDADAARLKLKDEGYSGIVAAVK